MIIQRFCLGVFLLAVSGLNVRRVIKDIIEKKSVDINCMFIPVSFGLGLFNIWYSVV